MNIWLYSSGDGDENEAMDTELMSSIHAPRPRLTFIPTEREEADEYYDEFIDRFAAFGYINFDMQHLDQPVSDRRLRRLLDSDMIYFSGGNTYSLLHALRSSGFDRYVERYVRGGGFVAGHSAGAIIMTPVIDTAGYPDEEADENEVGITDLTGMNLVPFEYFPHYQNRPSWIRRLCRESEKVNWPIFAVPDGSGICIEGPRLSFFGKVWGFSRGMRFRIR